jgi:dihydrolipoamide dehydrogenase
MVYDVLIIGGGPGGYVCALRSAQLGLKVALVEEKKLGGVCLHWGCIPTKALYAATRLLRQASTATEMGIEFGAPTLDLARLAAWKDGVIARLAGGIEDLVKAAGIDVFTDRACLAGPNAVRVSCGETLAAANIVLATGSRPIEIPGFSFSHPRIWSSDDALALEAVPARLAIVGGGVIGLELGTIYRRLGSDVTIIELLPEILPTLDVDRRAVAAVKRGLVASGIRILTGSSATSCEDRGDCLTLTMSDGSTLDVERVLIAVGRRPSSAELGLETVGLEPDRRHTRRRPGVRDRGARRLRDRRRRTRTDAGAQGLSGGNRVGARSRGSRTSHRSGGGDPASGLHGSRDGLGRTVRDHGTCDPPGGRCRKVLVRRTGQGARHAGA